jgi:hypothetical protein
VYFPDYGWIPFDPTPGWNGEPQTGNIPRWIFSGAVGDLNLPALPLGEIASFIGGSIGTILTVIAVVAGVVALVLAARRWRIPLRGRWQRLTQRDPARRAIFAAYRRAQRRLKSYRGEAQTVSEHAAGTPELQELAALVEIAAYRPEAPDAGMVQKAKDLMQRRRE